MRQLEVENHLRDVVSRIIVQVELATSQGRTDINLALEDAFIPILKSVFNLPHLTNLNRRQKNFPGIDLGDDHDRVAFQITSTTTLDKVKFTVRQFMDQAYYNTFDELFILMLARKQSSYSQASVNELLTDQFAFNCKKHIIDLGDLLGQVSGLRLAAQERVLSEFQHILGEVDAYISFSSESVAAPTAITSNLQQIRLPEAARLRAVRASILVAYHDYVAAAPEVADLPEVKLDDEQAEALIHAYEVETKPMADLRAKLMKPVVLARCPFCGLGESSTLDHYLPKEQHPYFAVFSRNLVPCCSPCNTRKSELVADEATDVRLFLHPYFDEVPNMSFVRLSVTLLPDALGLSFGMRRPGGMTAQTFQHLQSHFRLLRLADRYRTMSLEHLRDRRRALARFYGPARDAERVAAELLQDAEDFEGDFGPNHWRAILYRTLAADEAFCDGGFRVLSRIQ